MGVLRGDVDVKIAAKSGSILRFLSDIWRICVRFRYDLCVISLIGDISSHLIWLHIPYFAS